jgi:hypothetical protein
VGCAPRTHEDRVVVGVVDHTVGQVRYALTPPSHQFAGLQPRRLVEP